MTSKNEIFYLQDIEPPRKPTVKQEDKDVTIATAHVNVQTAKALKRQRSIAEMFPSQPSSCKRQNFGSKDAASMGTKSSQGVAPLNSIPLDLNSFRASLTDEVKDLLHLELETIGKSWLKVLIDEIEKPYFISLKRWLASEGLSTNLSAPGPKKLKIFPPAKEIYTWSQTPLGQVRVVILGQDPYHAPGQAHGLSFSVPIGVTPPPSLKNIYAEIQAEYPEFVIPKHGNLSAWAASGVVLLNTCLTVRAHEAGSHSNRGWEQFTDRVVEVIDRYGGANISSQHSNSFGGKSGTGRGIVFLAWGAWAQKRVAKLNKTKHLILTSAHPSPFSAHKGFFGNNHFKAANAWLEERYGKDGTVDWCKLEIS